MPDLLTSIDSEIRAGLKNETARLDDALYNLEFYRGDFSRFPPRSPGNQYDSKRYPRTSLVMKRVINTLTANLYGQGPRRVLKAPPGSSVTPYEAASEWLNAVYRANAADAYWQDADRMAAVGDFAGFQVLPHPDPRRPVRMYLWRANELVVWLDPDDALKPVAVGTLDCYNAQRRLRLWTAGEKRTYLTQEWNPGQPNGATAYTLRKTEPNTLGFLPFSWVHWDFPTCYFHTDGPGTNLREVNDGVNFGLTEGFDCVRYNLRPVIVLKNVLAGWRPTSPVSPGDIWDLPAMGDGAESDPKQEAGYLQADSSFVAAGWDDLSSFLDHTLEMHGVPPSTIRMTQDSARSGVSIVAEQIPLILWAQSRQRPFAHYEDELAKLVLAVGAKHLGSQEYSEYRATADQLLAVAEEPGLVLRWPSMYPKLPGEERDRGDQWLLDNRFRSRTQLLMERDNLTREEAEKQLEETAEDLEREQQLFSSLDVAQQDDGQGGAAGGGDEGDGANDDDQTDDDDLEETDDDDGE